MGVCESDGDWCHNYYPGLYVIISLTILFLEKACIV